MPFDPPEWLFRHDWTVRTHGLFSRRIAAFSPCMKYRYVLIVRWDKGPLVNALMLNPSDATEAVNDPTVERWQVRSKDLGYSGFIVTNLNAYRSPHPSALLYVDDPVGPENDDAILSAAHDCDITVCGWGNNGKLLGRDARVVKMLSETGIKLHALRLTKTGQPEHPLYIPYSAKPFPLATSMGGILTPAPGTSHPDA